MRMKHLTLALFFTLITLTGCGRELTKSEKGFQRVALSHPTTFSLPKAEADAAWGRAQSFVGRHSNMKLQIATDYVLQTYNPTGSAVLFGYDCSRSPMGDSVTFTVTGTYGNMFSRESAVENAHYLAYYIATGKEMPSLINK
jgi:hypothetical protein